MSCPGVFEAAVIGVPDPRWTERPLVAVVASDGARLEPADIVAFLAERVPRWWLPERWTFVDELPKTSVGKFDKKVLRARAAEGAFEVQQLDLSSHFR
jgi:fatty-acyl-CoA synthase